MTMRTSGERVIGWLMRGESGEVRQMRAGLRAHECTQGDEDLVSPRIRREQPEVV